MHLHVVCMHVCLCTCVCTCLQKEISLMPPSCLIAAQAVVGWSKNRASMVVSQASFLSAGPGVLSRSCLSKPSPTFQVSRSCLSKPYRVTSFFEPRLQVLLMGGIELCDFLVSFVRVHCTALYIPTFKRMYMNSYIYIFI